MPRIPKVKKTAGHPHAAHAGHAARPSTKRRPRGQKARAELTAVPRTAAAPRTATAPRARPTGTLFTKVKELVLGVGRLVRERTTQWRAQARKTRLAFPAP